MLKYILNIIFFSSLVLLSKESASQIYVDGADFISSPSYVEIGTIKVANKKDRNELFSLTSSEIAIERSYLDGLGRRLELVGIKKSPTQKDIIQFFKYNTLGQTPIDYLPYLSSDGTGSYHPVYLNNPGTSAITEQANYYQNGTSDKVADDTKPYRQEAYEQSPAQRLLKIGSLGDNFQIDQNYKSMTYRSNTSLDAVRIWETNGTSFQFYSAGVLTVKEGTDERGNKQIIFIDKVGREILKRDQIDETIQGNFTSYLETYYVYDDIGRLAFIVPPNAVAKLKIANPSVWDLANNVDKLVFYFKYDSKSRISEKKVPGSQPTYIVYDPQDRPLLIQDGLMKTSNKWYYFKYDSKGRTVSEGVYQNSIYTSQSTMQTYVDGTYGSNFYEERNISTNGYSNVCFPNSNLEDWVYYYYDDYDFDGNGTADYSYQSQGLPGEGTSVNYVRAILTGIKKRVIGSSNWLLTIYFFDKNGNKIQTQTSSQLNSSVTSYRTVVVDFTGKVIRAKTVKNIGTFISNVENIYAYDHADRIIQIQQSNYTGSSFTVVAAYEYNELGQLVDKKLHSTNGITFLQSLDFRWNIRNQLVSVNNSSLTSDAGITNDESNDLFGLQILYNTFDAGISNANLYNGLISGVKWSSKTNSTPDEKSYSFEYDKLNRLKNAFYKGKAYGTSTWTKEVGAFDEKNISYDYNGNILTLKRYKSSSGIATLVDDLAYAYNSNNDNNQLLNITESSSTSDVVGFRNYTGSNLDYEYDENGNLKKDPKKGITITYNLLNKPDRITFYNQTNRYIQYTYDSKGVRLTSQIVDNGVVLKKIDYIEEYVYETVGSTTNLLNFSMSEGRVRKNGNTYTFEYVITDHQGNARVSFEDQGGTAVVVQENSYYPFGLLMPGYTWTNTSNKKLFNNGSTWQNDFANLPDYYSTFYRDYDPVLGRFTKVDPKAIIMASETPYSFASNNPVNANDPFGDVRISDFKDMGAFLNWIGSGGDINSLTDFHNDEILTIFSKGDYIDEPDVQISIVNGMIVVSIVGTTDAGTPGLMNAHRDRATGEVGMTDQDYKDGVISGQQPTIDWSTVVIDFGSFWNKMIGNDVGAMDYVWTGLALVGGLAEMSAGLLTAEFGVGVYATVDGFTRTSAAFYKLGLLLDGRKLDADAAPGNLGAVLGKGIDYTIGSDEHNWQKSLGFANDVATIAITGFAPKTAGDIPQIISDANAFKSALSISQITDAEKKMETVVGAANFVLNGVVGIPYTYKGFLENK